MGMSLLWASGAQSCWGSSGPLARNHFQIVPVESKQLRYQLPGMMEWWDDNLPPLPPLASLGCTCLGGAKLPWSPSWRKPSPREVKWGEGPPGRLPKRRTFYSATTWFCQKNHTPPTPVEFYLVHFKTSCISAIIIFYMFITWFHFSTWSPRQKSNSLALVYQIWFLA